MTERYYEERFEAGNLPGVPEGKESIKGKIKKNRSHIERGLSQRRVFLFRILFSK
jgi:hypothetical protein